MNGLKKRSAYFFLREAVRQIGLVNEWQLRLHKHTIEISGWDVFGFND